MNSANLKYLDHNVIKIVANEYFLVEATSMVTTTAVVNKDQSQDDEPEFSSRSLSGG